MCQAMFPAGRGVDLHRLRTVAVAQALLAVAQGADLAAGVAAGAAGKMLFPEGPALGRGHGFEAGQLVGLRSAVSSTGSGSAPRTWSAPSGSCAWQLPHLAARLPSCASPAFAADPGAGDAEQHHVFALQLVLADQAGHGAQVAPLDHHRQASLAAHLLLVAGEVEGEVVVAAGREDQLARPARRVVAMKGRAVPWRRPAR